ncbi:MAG: tRNA (N(6)-L-threonylcarbamoyladenosine(37)-C(2))-methylthiotransferase MtaB [SAR202 cluster bacterium]|nr:tRNA (N(6)-L-threonylcarbamoyladenosine(37)-C(2))-methylthiotransferase MtaB [SAR202 cluster bacterium]
MASPAPRVAATVAIETHGCKLNQADSAALARELKALGYTLVPDGEAADVYVVNSCTVTHIADRKARHALRAARRRNPNATIVATGCYAQRAPDDLRRLVEVDLVVGNADKPTLARRIADRCGESPVPCAVGAEEVALSPRALRTRAMVKIQEGCDQVCAYCIVPKVRGRERSVPPEHVLAQIRRYVSDGYKETVLTGTQLGTYGFDLPSINLAGLVRRILSETDIARLRVSSLQPQEMNGELLALWSDPRLCPHFHVPLQSGSDAVLKRMRRRYTARQYADAVSRVRAGLPYASITADVICGFPGETDGLFEETLALCREVGFADLHVFPFSARPGTSAVHFDGHVDADAKAMRVAALMALAQQQAADFRDGLLGQTRPVLWEERERGEHGLWSGLTDNYVRVVCDSGVPLSNRLTAARLVERRGEEVRAEVG